MSAMDPLLRSVYEGDACLCKKLLDEGSDPNASMSVAGGYTALMFAAMKDQTDVIKLLLNRGATRKKTNDRGETAASLALFIGKPKAAELIRNFVPEEVFQVFSKDELKEHQITDREAVALYGFFNDTPMEPRKIVQHIHSSSVISGKTEKVLETVSSIASRDWGNYPIALKAMYLSGMVAWSVASSLKSKVVCEGEVLTTDPSDMVKEALEMASCPAGLKDLVRTVTTADDAYDALCATVGGLSVAAA